MKYGLRLLGVVAVLAVSAGTMRASILYSLTISLSNLNAGSNLSGSALSPDPLGIGGMLPITLTASPAADYTPSTLAATLSIGAGPIGFNSVLFSPFNITDNTSGHPLVILINGAAHCAVDPGNPLGVPCSTNGQWIGNNQFGGSGTYTVSISEAPVPEPGSAIVLVGLAALAGFRRYLAQLS